MSSYTSPPNIDQDLELDFLTEVISENERGTKAEDILFEHDVAYQILSSDTIRPQPNNAQHLTFNRGIWEVSEPVQIFKDQTVIEGFNVNNNNHNYDQPWTNSYIPQYAALKPEVKMEYDNFQPQQFAEVSEVKNVVHVSTNSPISPTSKEDVRKTSTEKNGGIVKRSKLKDPENVELRRKIKELEARKTTGNFTKADEDTLLRLRNNLSCRESRETKKLKMKNITTECDKYKTLINSILQTATVPEDVKLAIQKEVQSIQAQTAQCH